MEIDPKQLRNAVLEGIPSTFANSGAEPELGKTYTPKAHLKALRLECSLVVGARGVGKSFWTAALASPEIRSTLGKDIYRLQSAEVSVGYSVKADNQAYPDQQTFQKLISEAGISAYDVWRSVVVRWLAKLGDKAIPSSSWLETAKWVEQHPEEVATIVKAADDGLSNDGKIGLIVFDALDRTSSDWVSMNQILRDLLRVVLWLESFRSLFGKVFLREDQLEGNTNFPDASKLTTNKAELDWASYDLHGLLWQTLINAPHPHGDFIRQFYTNVSKSRLHEQSGVWFIGEDAMKSDPLVQRKLFEGLAGEWMGKDRRRGRPYSWIVSHLADGKGRSSPRSFLAAIKKAAEDTEDRYPQYGYALHHESIKKGVQKASQIRVDEMAEDNPWVKTVMQPLKGQSVPVEYALIEGRWVQSFPNGPSSLKTNQVPAQNLHPDWMGVRKELERLGVFIEMRDQRINLPDLYRVGFGLGRKGGVKPVQ